MISPLHEANHSSLSPKPDRFPMTTSAPQTTTKSNKAVIKSVALPAEHGGWGFTLEPIFLGMLVAPSWYGALLGLSALAVFLIHQPVKVATKDRIKGRRPIRTVWAERFA